MNEDNISNQNLEEDVFVSPDTSEDFDKMDIQTQATDAANSTKTGLAYNVEDFDIILQELQLLIGKNISEKKEHYKRTALRPMKFFRISGVLIIILSVSVPLLSTLNEFKWSYIVLSIATLSIAGLTGLNSFFNWQFQWQSHRQTQYALEQLLGKWELVVIRAQHLENKEEAIQIILTSSEEFLDNAYAITRTQTVGYFQGIQLNQT